MMIELISQYLKTHRRLNIPGVGAFMVKDSHGEILFSELLKRDDGVLRSLLAERGMGEIEVAATIDRFVFELKHDTESVGGEFVMAGFGVLRREEGGRLLFVVQAQEQEEVVVDVVTPDEPTVEVEEITPEEPKREADDTPTNKPEVPANPDSTSRYTAERIKELYSTPKTFREKDPELGDLTYSKRQKPLGGYTYVNSEPKRKGVDKVLLFGIIAAIIAVAVIAYGYYVGHVVRDGSGSIFDFGKKESAQTLVEEKPQPAVNVDDSAKGVEAE
ncbi:MAG: hypothetical protein SNH35_02455 [Rikenellaceae bacterium]